MMPQPVLVWRRSRRERDVVEREWDCQHPSCGAPAWCLCGQASPAIWWAS